MEMDKLNFRKSHIWKFYSFIIFKREREREIERMWVCMQMWVQVPAEARSVRSHWSRSYRQFIIDCAYFRVPCKAGLLSHIGSTANPPITSIYSPLEQFLSLFSSFLALTFGFCFAYWGNISLYCLHWPQNPGLSLPNDGLLACTIRPLKLTSLAE